MHCQMSRLITTLAAIVVGQFLVKSAHAGNVIWTIDTAQSHFQLGIDIYTNGEYAVSFVPQGPGAEIAPLSGTVTTDVDGASIQFLSAAIAAGICRRQLGIAGRPVGRGQNHF